MWDFIFNLIVSFRTCFSRAASFDWFSLILIGIMIRSDKLGLTSVIRDLNLKGECYEKIMHFFRADSWDLDTLHDHWYSLIQKYSVAYLHKGKPVFVIDGTKQSKEGHYMPGVKKMANDSDTQSKPQTMHGHMGGMLSLLIGTEEKMAALPLKMTIRQEIYATLIMHNYARFIANNIYVTDDKGRKLNFKTVATLCREFLKGLESENEMTEKIKIFLIPIRPGRSFERRMRPKSAIPLATKAA